MLSEYLLRRPAPGLAAAEHADAAFDTQRVRTGDGNMTDVTVAVVGVVDLAGPFVVAVGAHAGEQRQADDRTPSQRRIGVLVVGLGLSGRGIDRGFQPDHHAANAAAAFRDAHPRVAGLGQPDPADLAAGLRPR